MHRKILNFRRCCLSLICLILTSAGAFALQPQADSANSTDSVVDRKSRTFRFIYGATINNLKSGEAARVWIPVAQTNNDQIVKLIDIVGPKKYCITADSEGQNKVLYFEAKANAKGEIPLDVTYDVTRFEVTADGSAQVEEDLRRFLHSTSLEPERGVTINRLLTTNRKGKPQKHGLARIREIYNSVDELLRYDKTKPGWGRGDVLWACDSGTGNCCDFHSVFIAACRDIGTPARFEIGFPIPAGNKSGKKSGEVAGYHCWGRFVADGKWRAVDISEADKHPEMKEYYFGNLTADRIHFTTGRDITLNPPQETGALNFFIYPHVEVNGKRHTDFVKRFRFEER